MKQSLSLMWRHPEYETCVLLQDIPLGLLIFVLLLLCNEEVHQYGKEKLQSWRRHEQKALTSIRKSINPYVPSQSLLLFFSVTFVTVKNVEV